MDESVASDRVPICIHFRGLEPKDCPEYTVSAATHAALMSDWTTFAHAPAHLVMTSIQHVSRPRAYPVLIGTEERHILLRLEDVLFID